MHQDLYSVLYGDGTPEWATLTDGASHDADSPVWSDAYFSSGAVQAALDHFWGNAAAPDGVGLQDHYARAWALLAAHYADEPTVIGYDLMNEPFPGTPALQAQGRMFARGAELLAERAGPSVAGTASPSPEALAEQWTTAEGRTAILEALRYVDLYAQVVDATEPLYAQFERAQLMALYRRVAQAIRQVDRSHILFLETTMALNMGVYSAIEPLSLAGGGRDPLQAYAPHGYDLVTDTPSIAQASSERVALIFRRHGETAERLGMPMLVGEWGAYGHMPGTLSAAWEVVRLFEDLLCSETYWAYEDQIEETPSFQAIHRPHPERVAGTLLNYRCDPSAGSFACTWQEDGRIAAPRRVYVPGWLASGARHLELAPPGKGYERVTTRLGSDSCYLLIPPTGQACTRRLVVRQ